MRRRTAFRPILTVVALLAGSVAVIAAPAAHAGPDCSIPPSGHFQDATGSATLSVVGVDAECLRTYRLVSSITGERRFRELPGKPVLRTGSAMLDGLYAMAHDDAELNKTDQVSDGSYNHGNPTPCPGGCYITGKSWTYVWTRDVSYSADLGLTAADPARMRNTLLFKLSDRRDGSGDTQIVQDTGTGGSHPNSTDRVVWALGASEILDWLPDGERQTFAAKAFDAIRNTVEYDRGVVYDPTDGLYLGEQSFLDWREQSYPAWTKDDVAPIATSRALSTNVVHWSALDAAARLAAGAGDHGASTKYRGWADSLATAIRTRFWLPQQGQFSQMLTTELDTAPARRYDALATSLAVLTGVATADQAAQAVRNYPATPHGPAVIWPQQQDVPAYHNNGIWPFVTAYLMRAAAKVGNDGVATAQARSLVRGAALFGTNKENINLLTGGTDTVINSDRQLWSVAGMMSMVQQSLFGVDARPDGLHIAPFLPAQLRAEHFAGSDRATLAGLRYRGRTLNVELRFPQTTVRQGAYAVRSSTLNGRQITPGTAITESMLGSGESTLVVQLDPPASSTAAPGPVDTSAKEALYGPRTPEVRDVSVVDGRIRLGVHAAGEDPARVTMDVLRDGSVIAQGVPVASTWTDGGSTAPATNSYCYSVRLRYTSSGNTSQHARPNCYWGPNYDRVLKVTGDGFEAVGGYRTTNANGTYYANWGNAAGDKLTARVRPTVTGDYLLQTDAAVGNPINTGVAGGIKLLRVVDDASGAVVAERPIAMPNTGSWSRVNHSTFVDARLTAGRTYRLELVNSRTAVNMSYFTANAAYNDTAGGHFNYNDVFAIKALLKKATG